MCRFDTLSLSHESQKSIMVVFVILNPGMDEILYKGFSRLIMQVGVGNNYQLHAIRWKWKLTTCFGGDGVSRIRNKTSLGLCPGVDFRFCWRADYVLPEITGQVLDPSSVAFTRKEMSKEKNPLPLFSKANITFGLLF